jgi:hypothetical protein
MCFMEASTRRLQRFQEIAMHATVHHSSASRDSAALRLNPAGQLLELTRARHAHLRGAGGWTVRALAGTVWITLDGDIRDVVLDAGQSFRLDRNSPALLSALGSAKVCVMRTGLRRETAAAPGYAVRLSPA